MNKFQLALVCCAANLLALTLQAQPPMFITSIATTPAVCPNADSATVTVTLNGGGTPPYTVTLSGVTPQPAGPGPSFTYTGLTGGFTYDIVATDSTLPTPFIDTASIMVTNFLPVSIASATFAPPSCAGRMDGTISVTAIGGTPPLTYCLNGGTPQSSGTFTGLVSGDYTVNVIPFGDTCGGPCNNSVFIALTGPGQVVITPGVITPPMCNAGTGSFTVAVSGGTPPYTVTATPTLGTPTTPDGINFTFSNVPVGTSPTGASYTINATDSTGCTAIPVAVTVPQPANNANSLVVLSVSTTPTSCSTAANGTLTINATPGFPNLTYTITGPATRTQANNNVFTGLPAGTYMVQVETSPGIIPFLCAVGSAVVTAPAPIVITPKVTNQDIINDTLGSLVVTITGGTAPYTVTVNPGNMVQTGGPSQFSFTFSNLAANTYTISVVDANGCPASTTATVACTRGQSTNPITNFITTALCMGSC